MRLLWMLLTILPVLIILLSMRRRSRRSKKLSLGKLYRFEPKAKTEEPRFNLWYRNDLRKENLTLREVECEMGSMGWHKDDVDLEKL